MATIYRKSPLSRRSAAQDASQAPAVPQEAATAQPGPVAPGPDMYDPRLLVDIIKSGRPDIGGKQPAQRDRA